MTLKIVTVTFDFYGSDVYQQLHDVFIYSIEKHNPEAVWISNSLLEPHLNGQVKGFITNTVKLMKWVEELEMCDEGDHVILMDCDMLVIGDLSEAFGKDFDVAYTYRTQCKYPVNGGVIFVKVNKRSIEFFKKFLEINNRMLIEDLELHKEYRAKYAGMNQAAFGYMLEHESHIARLDGLPCSTWNVCDHYTEALAGDARVLHIKGKLRKNIFAPQILNDDLEKPTLMWQEYKRELDEQNKGTDKAC